MSAVVDIPTGAEAERGIEIFSRTSLGHGGHEWTLGGRAAARAGAAVPGHGVGAVDARQERRQGPAYDHRIAVRLSQAE